MQNLINELFDNDAIHHMHMMRDRRQLIDAIIDIEQALDNPAHGAHGTDLHSDIKSIIDNLKTQWKENA
jgi:hypothetical protein